MAAIIFESIGDVATFCDGPTALGGCPRAGPDDPVACSGRFIAASGPSARTLLLRVEAGTGVCPLSLLGPAFLSNEHNDKNRTAAPRREAS